MRPVLFEVFGFHIRSYSFFIAVAFMSALWLATRVAKRRRPQYAPLIDEFAVVALVSAIVGARLWEVIFTWEYYSKHLGEIFAVWNGGISIQGAIAGGAVAAVWFTHKHKLSFWDFADTLTPGVLLGQAIGRLGACLLNGDAYGKPTGSSFGIIYAPGSMAYQTFGPVPLWPAEVFEGVWDLGVLLLTLWLLRKERPQGTVFLWYVVLYSAGRFGLEFLRADSLQFFGMKAAQVTSVILALLALFTLVYRNRNTWRTPRT
ncbi:MAG TPA: prolipoprotein diacylglyceryl transferase [Symbiobacteriaceae bacterium]|nr:prolipoprotein diacylglyceryl transferase [Symbiobacteriaceae bacterium]